MAIELKEVKTRGDLRKFVMFPFKLYKGNEYWVPPFLVDEYNTFRRDKNPAYEYCDAKFWLAYKDGKLAGRIVGIINRRYIEKWKNRYVRFGWIDFIDDKEVSGALLNAVITWGKEQGMAGIHGPLGFTDLDKEGMLIEGFKELGTLPMIYNHPYYPVHMEYHGFRKDVDWLEFEVRIPETIPEKYFRLERIVFGRNGLRVLDARKPKDFLPYARQIFYLINEAYAHLYGVVDLTDKQIDKYVKQYFGFIHPDFTKVILDGNGNVAAFFISMPSMSRAMQKAKGRILPFGFVHLLKALKFPKQIDFYLIAIRKDLQNKGLNAIMVTEIHKACLKHGVVSAESAGELEDNMSVQLLLKYFNPRQHKRRRCFIKEI